MYTLKPGDITQIRISDPKAPKLHLGNTSRFLCTLYVFTRPLDTDTSQTGTENERKPRTQITQRALHTYYHLIELFSVAFNACEP